VVFRLFYRLNMAKKPAIPDIAGNPKAKRDYHIVELFEAGLVLRGTEVKSLRAGRGEIRDAFARVENGEVWLYNAHIEEYRFGNWVNHEPRAKRKLLLNKSEIRKLFGLVAVKGNALVPLSLYWKNGKVKVKLAVGKGKVDFDKREDIKERDSDRELKRAMMHQYKGK
jgi:SsrA-binding protein